MLGRRFLVLVAVLIGLTVIAASLAPRQPVPRDQRAAEPTPTPSPAGESAAVTEEKLLSTKGRPKRIAVERGALFDLVVDGDELDSVSFEGEVEIVTEETNARFSVYADRLGEFPIELVEANRLIGTLVVRE